MNPCELIRREEQEIVKRFFNIKNPEIPPAPDYLNKTIIQYWRQLNFNIHYLPKISLKQELNLFSWKDKPHKIFYKKIKENKISQEAIELPGKWILIDSRDKPQKRGIWITSDEINLIKRICPGLENYFKKKNKQAHKDEYLKEILNKMGFNSRFCLSVKDIDKLKPFILRLLKIKNKTIRLPYFMEYNYLGNTVYQQWARTKTWEWFEDIYDKKQHLAGGSNSVGAIGWDPINYWSTILTFRPVIEL